MMYTEDSPKTVIAENLTMVYGDLIAVNQINFNVAKGEIRGVLGGNGAGKSTTLKILGGVMKPSDGTVLVSGHNMRSFKGSAKARTILGYCPDVGGLISGATPVEHVKLLATLHRDKDLYDKGLQSITDFGLEPHKHSPTSGFSHGMSRRLSVLLAALTAKDLLILDEPYDGVDPTGVDVINSTIKEAQSRGVSVILSTHLQNLLTDVSDTISIMKGGQVLDTLPKNVLEGAAGTLVYREYLTETAAEPAVLEVSS